MPPGVGSRVNEFELKFQVPPERSASVDAALRRGTVARERLRARYFDTEDQVLAKQQLVLRIRQEGRGYVQTAKGPGHGGFDRLEHNVTLSGDAELPDISLHDVHPLGSALREALDGKSSLRPVFETDVLRRSRLLKTAGTTLEIAFDQGRIRAGKESLPVLELEFELKQGSPATLVELAGRWCEQHGLWLDPLSKSEAARRLADGVTVAPPVHAGTVKSADTAPALLANILDAALAQVLGNARELAVGVGGDEHVHQLRVGLRRLRAALRDLQVWAPIAGAVAEVQEPLRALFSLLGEHRDRSILLPRIGEQMAAAGAPVIGWDPVLPDVGAAVRDTAWQLALLRLVALVQELRAIEGASLKQARKEARTHLQKLHARVLKKGRRFCELPQDERHSVRKRLKRLRYLADLVRPLFAGKEVDRYVASLGRLQDALGEYQDAVAGRQLFTARAATDGGAWFAAGWLAAQEEELAARCERACKRTADEASPFWQ